MPDIYDYPHTVIDEEIDEIGVVSNVTYIRWLNRAAVAHSTTQGWSTEDYLRHGAGWVVRSHSIVYRRPALPGDDIVVRTWVATMGAATSLRRYRIIRTNEDEELLATAETLWAFIDFTSRRPARISPEIAGAFQIVDKA